MSFNQIKLILSYWQLKSHLTDDLGYDNTSAVRQIREIRKMEPNILRLFLRWFKTDQLPEDRINGVTVGDIIERHNLYTVHRKMDVPAAFLSLNWVQTNSEEAKYSLSHPADELHISENSKELLRRIAKKNGWEIMDEETEDTSDLSEK